MSEFKLYVAEKPSVGKALAGQLAKRSAQTSRSGTHIEGKDWAVCWLAGHAYALAEPDYYIERWHPEAKRGANGRFRWSFDHLPILPANDEWKIVPVEEKAELIGTVRTLLKRATVVIHAGDIDREGQLLVDEVLDDLGCRLPVRRVLPKAIDDTSLQRALADERDNRDFARMRDAAIARGRGDWLFGMNGTEGVTLQAQASGSSGVVPIGRVQTPVLGLIAARELEIRNFKPVEYLALTAIIVVQAGNFRARWRPKVGQAGLDDSGRLLDPAVAAMIHQQVVGKAGRIAEYRDEQKNENAPLPFSLDELQRLASRRYGFPLDQTLKIVQGLYDAQLVTYPRTDCSFLPSSQHAEAAEIVRAARESFRGTELPAQLSQIDVSRKSRAFDDKRVSAHHAIVPTPKAANLDSLGRDERLLYEEICRRYLAQFMAPHTYRKVTVRAEIAGHDFTASGRTTLKPGWKELYGKAEQGADQTDAAGERNDEGNLPPMRLEEPARCDGLDREQNKTEPPSRFTDDTLLEAMVNIHKYVTTPQVKAHFVAMLEKSKSGSEDEAQGCGIGTPATRHTFAPKLVNAGLVELIAGKKKAKFFAPTAAGLALYEALPKSLTTPDATAVWDMAFGRIEAGEITLDQFMAFQARQIKAMLEEIRKLQIVLPDLAQARSPGAKTGAGKRKAVPKSSRKGSNASGGEPCAKCGKGTMQLRNSARGSFYGCSNFPVCKHTAAA
ncbi:DNA topoisomerase-3 [Xanthomonas sacchari]|uniref:DNA topoisomerase n=1 Tax=Xanthomonas sacchari TaxID=56458 RepID=UPI0027895B8D|nr:DNA topoisomerase [Xanthomonas sacchari]MDQ1090692.1 DNA topoisomerase-3 [Xanthomonas sacchari]